MKRSLYNELKRATWAHILNINGLTYASEGHCIALSIDDEYTENNRQDAKPGEGLYKTIANFIKEGTDARVYGTSELKRCEILGKVNLGGKKSQPCIITEDTDGRHDIFNARLASLAEGLKDAEYYIYNADPERPSCKSVLYAFNGDICCMILLPINNKDNKADALAEEARQNTAAEAAEKAAKRTAAREKKAALAAMLSGKTEEPKPAAAAACAISAPAPQITIPAPAESIAEPTQSAEPAQAMQSAPTQGSAQNDTTESHSATESAEKEETMKDYTITPNPEKNGIEIYFTAKPAESIREALKALRFRWHGVKKCWYGRADRATVESILNGAQPAETAPKAEKAAAPEKYDLDGLEGNTCRGLYGTDLNKAIRAEFKKRGVTGVTICGRRGSSVTFTITMRPGDFRSVEECAARDNWSEFFRQENSSWGFTINGVNYSYSNQGRQDETHKYISCGSAWDDESEGSKNNLLRDFWRDKLRKFSPEHHFIGRSVTDIRLTDSGRARLEAIHKIIDSFNYDNSDSMTDYFDRGFYDYYEYKMPEGFEPVEKMTAAEYEKVRADKEAEKAAEAARFAEYEREREEYRKAEEERQKKEEADRAEIAQNMQIIDLDEDHTEIITNLANICGKECNLAEVREYVAEHGTGRLQDAQITRKLIFTDPATLEKFNNMFMYDFEFLAGKGGTGTDDPRVNDGNIYQLTEEQRKTIKWYICEAVAVYLGEVLQYVIDPEGYSYARYVHLPTGCTEERQKADTEPQEAKPDFYIPEPVATQAAGIQPGEDITILQDSIICRNMLTEARGKVDEITEQNGDIYITLSTKQRRRTERQRVRVRNNIKALAFRGILPPLPDSVVYKTITNSGGTVCKMGADNAEQLKRALEHFAGQGITPIIDTVAR